MEIKRKLNKLASRLSPQIEAMNIGIEMNRIADRLGELIDYAEEKQERATKNKESMGVRVDRERREERERVQAIHDEEAKELAMDQEQHKAQPDVEPLVKEEHVISDEEAEATLQSTIEDAPKPKKRRTKKQNAR